MISRTTDRPLGGSARSHRLEQDIERTREDMDRTIDQLADKLNPRRVVSRVVESVLGVGDGGRGRDTQSSRGPTDVASMAGQMLLDRAGRHPLPAALLSAGAVLLVLEQMRGRIETQPDEYEEEPIRRRRPLLRRRLRSRFISRWRQEEREPGFEGPGLLQMISRWWQGSAKPQVSEVSEQAMQSGSGFLSRLRDALTGARERARHRAEQWSDWASRGAGQSRQQAEQVERKVADWGRSTSQAIASSGRAIGQQAASLGQGVRQSYRMGSDAVQRTVEEYPLALAAAGVALGVAAGLLLRRSSREQEMFGRVSDEAMRKAGHAGAQVLQRGREVVKASLSSATGELKR